MTQIIIRLIHWPRNSNFILSASTTRRWRTTKRVAIWRPFQWGQYERWLHDIIVLMLSKLNMKVFCANDSEENNFNFGCVMKAEILPFLFKAMAYPNIWHFPFSTSFCSRLLFAPNFASYIAVACTCISSCVKCFGVRACMCVYVEDLVPSASTINTEQSEISV